MNALVMYDHQTDSLWSQFLGCGVRGPLDGAKLEVVSALQTDLAIWLELHPDSKVLEKPSSTSYDPYTNY
jgi:hypothetical protein